ncbi:hypothetical protein N7488_006327 [Penicillium malachiteum]|nr:hypothetical protein N7488_006327 [Penicillium malachiteum]
MGEVTRLLKTVESSTKVYLDYFQSKSLPEPSYQHGNGLDPRVPLPVEVAQAQQAAIEATDELHHLLLGPLAQLFYATGEQLVLLSIQYIYEYSIAAHVPISGSISIEDLA